MKQRILGFIGGGNMAGSLIGGLIADGYAPADIWVSDPDPAKLKELASRFGVHTDPDNERVAEQADILILAVKPQILQAVAAAMADRVQRRRPLVISIAAGITESALERWLGGSLAIVRCMPNTPALVKTGATALHANPRTTAEHRNQAEAILRAVGLTVWVDQEAALDAVTALSGSGPAYFFLVMEAMEAAAVELGLERATARLLTQQTALGAARIAIESEEPPAALRERVTSPGGTTERAILAFERGDLRGLVKTAMRAAAERAAELSAQLGS
ncbi:pyrroline-5-carboxylate reductase [Candidatus Methylocalor cossyra]